MCTALPTTARTCHGFIVPFLNRILTSRSVSQSRSVSLHILAPSKRQGNPNRQSLHKSQVAIPRSVAVSNSNRSGIMSDNDASPITPSLTASASTPHVLKELEALLSQAPTPLPAHFILGHTVASGASDSYQFSTVASDSSTITSPSVQQECQLQTTFSSTSSLAETSQGTSLSTFRPDLYFTTFARSQSSNNHFTSQGGSNEQDLGPACMGRLLLTTAEVSSTQDWMRQHAALLPPGAVLVADKQVTGKGRGSNVWTSPSGCLMFTASTRLQINGSTAPFINYVVSLAVLHGINEALADVAPGLDLGVRIKWPNDLHATGGRKIAGALIHTTYSSGSFLVHTGIGLNVDNTHPSTCLNQLLKEAFECQQVQQAPTHTEDTAVPASPAVVNHVTPTLTREVLLGCIMAKMAEYFSVFESQGFGPLESSYLAGWLHSNQSVTFTDDGTSSTQLVIKGLSQHGFLRAADSNGKMYELTPDGNSLDMMQGLLRRKL